MNNIIADKKCKYCNKAMENVQSARRKYCDDVCRGRFRRKHANETGTYKVVCSNCGECFRTYHDNKIYCSDKCRENSLGKNNIKIKREKIKLKKLCKECGVDFETSHSSMRFCSGYCRKRNKAKSNELKRRKYYQEGDTSISLIKLIDRDDNICHICNKICDINDYYVDDNGTIITRNSYPSIDHVIPLSKGGTHTWDNIKLAHRLCNTRKGIKLLK